MVRELAGWSLAHKDAIAESRRGWDAANPEAGVN